jgi:hypothetical protein
VLRSELTYPTLLRMRAGAFLPEFVGDGLRGMESGVFLVEGKERIDNADVPKRRDPFALDGISPNLLTAAHAYFARTIVDRAPVIECPGCGRNFTPSSGKQKYHDKRCANAARWRRWNQKQTS